MSFSFAVIRPTQWLEIIAPQHDKRNVAIYECDVVCDTSDMTKKQSDDCLKVWREIDDLMMSTLPPEAVYRYPYVHSS